MKRKKLLTKVADFFNLSKRKQCERQDKLKELLAQLRDKEHKLCRRIAAEEDRGRAKRWEKEVQIIHAQRIKGIRQLKELNCDD
ncbi:MAG: hypothetical protein AB2807_08350 [Candidatus Sedimenticola endophacoides]|uniref:Uncharacterized protein n=1 Tax=Candidatus Sedimenticola endophacoides TaxID=2548426 RepID=A0A6N4DRC3_9GAMM|nr:MAG: hypothetical protein B0D89_12585 [Candidatus Sedimenticola endophacoides]PUE00842.1 MAG: hypothetical protein C3L26_04910 [Candidatus Sedimenticola endophacoides]PUE00871.1 MAG: hypothetical protein C3L24_08775 [Candidatus Sedimenticola endophacoides]PUE04280.1 MAG: hypothetical protein C3L25_04900 [Candidatus Sedimenticola endophacoides]